MSRASSMEEATTYLVEQSRATALSGLTQAYLTTFNELGIETWLAHGSLLGVWWGKRDTYFFPLRKTTFEDVEARIPYRYRELLAMEYGEGALNKTEQNE
ncbi:hypothetical protein NEMBOFW57_002997 [Staphylotrichum longicolle]|uniref:LicD/FKTN/FKRP nucleotidyltransferase domain-containing protein n=1 Tax=Staphylotrichum longicolle TaxID=669026 RepID=A0AAD4I293_9PEZI|nr:hypothetical protein NEMBOFW57_002997 [Staphylotrichum longicolle]